MNEEMQPVMNPDMIGGPMAPDPNSPVEVVDVQFRTGSKVYFFDPDGIELKAGDHVIIETTRGPEYGTCATENHSVPFRDIVPPLRKVLRIATENDDRTLEENRAKEKRAFEICLQKIQEHKLDMQLVSAEYAFDGSKILFFFTSDDRVDFRELVKHLAGIFRTRIELRQIGVRDKAKMVGGLGICGRPFCCSEFLDDFQPVSIKMAKTQNLSLNPTKISGTCGRLMCCLKYEQEAYEDLLRTSPKAESFVDTPDGRGTVIDISLLRQTVKVRLEENPETVNVYQNSEICVLRNGKAKKNDPPIPADLAPISGNGKRPRQPKKEEEEQVQLDPIRFRYRPDDIVEEPEEGQEGQEEQDYKKDDGPRKPAEDRHRKKPRAPESAEVGQQPGQKPEGEEVQKNRNSGHRRRPGGQKPRESGQQREARPPRPQQERKGKQDGEAKPSQEGESRPDGKSRSNYRRRRPQRLRKPQNSEGPKSE